MPLKVYENTIFNDTITRRKVIGFRSFGHSIKTYEMVKDALTSYYDKFEMLDNVNCQPYGYKQQQN